MGFETNHKERDLALPKHREDLLNAIEEDLLGDENIIGLFYGGSIANNNTDLFSDIDLRIVVKDEVFEEYRRSKKQRANNWGRVLFFEDFPWTTHTVAHFDTFIKVDVFYYKSKDVQPSVWLQNIKVVHDSNGNLLNVLEQSMKLSYSPSEQDVEIWRTKFFAYVHEIYRRLKRKEIYYCLYCLDQLRLLMVTGWYMNAGFQPNSYGDWAKLEGLRSKLNKPQLDLLKQWHGSREPEDILRVVKSILPEFLNVHNRLCSKLKMDENPQLVEEILNMML